MARTNKSRFQLGFDTLEDRSVLAAGLSASLANGQLSILGTDDNDVITVRHIPAQYRVAGQIKIDGLTQTFDPAKVSRIVVQGGTGDDTITMVAPKWTSSKTGMGVELWGGDGNDLLTGSINADKLFGGAGNDTIYGRAGNDLIDGGEGKISFTEKMASTLFLAMLAMIGCMVVPVAITSSAAQAMTTTRATMDSTITSNRCRVTRRLTTIPWIGSIESIRGLEPTTH